jgi:hypothetical protein
MKTSQFIILFIVVLFSVTTAYKISSKHEQPSRKENPRSREEIVKTGVYNKNKNSGTNSRLGSFKSNITNKKSNRPKFSKRAEYNECDVILYEIESYLSSKQFISSVDVCSHDIKEYLKNIKKFQDCYPESNLSYVLETEIYSNCMVDDKGNLCPMARINRDKNFKLSPSIENYMVNCQSEKCRLQSIHLNDIHRKSFGEEITFLDNEEFDKVENYLNSSECLAMTME